jgi:hypothetical protein
MTPQSDFMVTAPLAAGREDDLKALLAGMNSAPGVADPHNAVLPFADFERLHFARLVVLDDSTVGDFEIHGVPPPKVPLYLALMGNCDGPSRELLAELARRAGAGLRRVFAHCERFDPEGDLLAWMLAHAVPPAALYVNWRGRTVRQVHEESALQRALASKVPHGAVETGFDVQALRRELIAFVQGEVRGGRLTLTPPAPTPPGWLAANLAHAVGVPLAALLASPLLLVLLPVFVWQLRRHETSDPELAIRPQAERLRRLQQLEDHDVGNQYTAIGEVKPGLFRHWTVVLLLLAIDYFCRHVYTRGYLARIRTIHFARWALLDDGRRVVFTSSYDGSHESYMDDFIGKVAWGLNLVFSNGVGYPHTDWLLKRGARREQRFKYFQRRHQLPTEVWYHAYPGLTAIDLARNRRIREGLERPLMSDGETLTWLRLL